MYILPFHGKTYIYKSLLKLSSTQIYHRPVNIIMATKWSVCTMYVCSAHNNFSTENPVSILNRNIFMLTLNPAVGLCPKVSHHTPLQFSTEFGENQNIFWCSSPFSTYTMEWSRGFKSFKWISVKPVVGQLLHPNQLLHSNLVWSPLRDQYYCIGTSMYATHNTDNAETNYECIHTISVCSITFTSTSTSQLSRLQYQQFGNTG